MIKTNHQELLSTLQECVLACNQCYDACLKEDDVKMMVGCIRLDRECADMCAYLSQAITRDSPFIKEIAEVCASICDACATECKQHSHDHCQRCAEACLKCAEACRQVA